eukprot:Tbor_TRINITY_DN5751_c2_g2::TRINITY_DN5751_c2_g2_i1::g.20792::m.20792/K20791/NAA10_11, ARD1_2; N-alpha-acetyltransferase 10/11
MQTRRANLQDLIEMQHTNLRCLPENYSFRYYYYHYLSWPQLLEVSHDYNNNIDGYVLAKLDDEEDEDKCHGHITSLAVLRTKRKLGIASKVMSLSMKSMEDITSANFCSLHVRKSNTAALNLYNRSLNFKCCEIEYGYYVDGENAYHMKKFFKGINNPYYSVDNDGELEGVNNNNKNNVNVNNNNNNNLIGIKESNKENKENNNKVEKETGNSAGDNNNNNNNNAKKKKKKKK